MSEFERNILEFEKILEQQPITKKRDKELLKVKEAVKDLNIKECEIYRTLANNTVVVELPFIGKVYKVCDQLSKRFNNCKTERFSNLIYINF
ncbi:hypothetical protein [Clostridium perfringens]|jgi:hypothetical protein|uniref:Uncharacterized protein n=1 Tax=Clostridium perfringens TaxID=1502 RepID=A0AAW4IY67_CLOPF|nr:hypothetical protein [Clostridium perfringens]MBO3356298.1 hypothetical protein [Clostridium perfringens]MBO3359571.1 hypothetical protein [Clostridium perfringens]